MSGHVSRPWSPKICTLVRVGLVSKISGLTGRLHKPKISESRLSARKTQETNINLIEILLLAFTMFMASRKDTCNSLDSILVEIEIINQ